MRLLVVFTMIIAFLLPSVVFADKDCQGMCGDANGDGEVNVSDCVWIINYVFKGGAEPQPVMACGDANTDGTVNVSDAVWIIGYVFVGGDPPDDCAPDAPSWYNGNCCEYVNPHYPFLFLH
jgi:Dockerin type I domain